MVTNSCFVFVGFFSVPTPSPFSLDKTELFVFHFEIDGNALLCHHCQIGCFQDIYGRFPLLLTPWTSCCLPLVWCPQPWVDVSELNISYAEGEIRYFSLYRLRFCIHQCSSSLVCFDRLSCPSIEDMEIITWICWCYKVLCCGGAGRRKRFL